MSLDIYIISPIPIKKKSTGIWVRKEGKTVELTKQEAQERYPDADIQEIEIETTEFWHGNITHNLNLMAEDCVCYDDTNLYCLLWRTYEPTWGKWIYVSQLSCCLGILRRDPEYFKQFNPENGWGTYEQLCEFVEDFIKALIDMPEGSRIEYSL